MNKTIPIILLAFSSMFLIADEYDDYAIEETYTLEMLMEMQNEGLEEDHPPNFIYEIDFIERAIAFNKMISNQDRELFTQKKSFHEKQAIRSLLEAQNIIFNSPQLQTYEIAQCVWKYTLSNTPPNTPQSKILSSIISAFYTYSIDCMKEWPYIHNRLSWSEYHWHMNEFYTELLK